MDKYIQIIKDIKPDLNYKYNSESFITILRENEENVYNINRYLLINEGFNQEFYERMRKFGEKFKEQDFKAGFRSKGKGTVDDPEWWYKNDDLDDIGTYGDWTTRKLKPDFIEEMIKKVTAKFKSIIADLYKRANTIYVQVLEKIGKILSQKGLNQTNLHINYEWDKIDFRELKSYINEFGSSDKLRHLSDYIFNYNPVGRLSLKSRGVDRLYSEKDEEHLTVKAYFDLMAASKPSEVTVESLKEFFSEKQKTITVNKQELGNFYKNDILSTMKILFDRIMKNQATLLKEVDIQSKEIKELSKDLKDLDNRGDDFDNQEYEDAHRLTKGQYNTKLRRMNKAIGVCIEGNAKFISVLFNVIIYGMHQYIKATIAAIKSVHDKKPLNKTERQDTKLLAAPAIR